MLLTFNATADEDAGTIHAGDTVHRSAHGALAAQADLPAAISASVKRVISNSSGLGTGSQGRRVL